MTENTVQVNMFGEFSLEWNGNTITSSSNRSKKIWLLLAYMIYNRKKVINSAELSELLWSEGQKEVDPRGALKTSFFRVRAILDGLGDDAGRKLILNDKGNYFWNPDIPVRLDCEEFETLCIKASKTDDTEKKLDFYQRALEEYRGPFLEGLSTEFWVMPIQAYFSNLYLKTTLEAVSLMNSQQLIDSAVALCKDAIKHEPYNEDLSFNLMSNLLDLHDVKGVSDEYNRISSLLNSSFSIQPRDDIRALFHKAEQTLNENAISMDTVFEQLTEHDALRGALVCDYDFFRILYRSAARSVARSGDVFHVVLVSVDAYLNETLSKRSLDRAMDNLQDELRINLRSGDAIARCSASQFVILFQQANYENCCMVSDRILKAFSRKYPHSPACLTYKVRPITPL